MSQLFASGGQSIEVSSSASILPMNAQDWSLLDGLVGSPCSLRDSQESSQAPQFESISSLVLSALYGPTLTSEYDYWKKTIALAIRTFVGKLMSLLFSTLSKFERGE